MSYGTTVRKIGPILSIPSFFIAGPLVGFGIGQWVDGKFATDPWGKILLLLFGFAAGIQQAVIAMRFWIRETKKVSK